MIEHPTDQAARDRFTSEWGVNLAVAANAGSGKTTASSERLAAMAMSAEGAELLGRTAVVTYTKKAAAGTIRADLAKSIEANVVHGSDAADTAAREIAFFFSGTELCPRA